MKTRVSRFAASLAGLLALWLSAPAFADDGVSITLAHGSVNEKLTAQHLTEFLSVHDLSTWTFTRHVVIEEGEIPHSHPVLTLHTRHRHDDELLISTYLHEQLHWFIAAHQEDANQAIAELREMYPKIPVGYPEGSSDEDGNYEHLLVVYFEYRADQTVFGELKAFELMHFWAEDHYRWIYRTVLADRNRIGEIASRHHLVPGA